MTASPGCTHGKPLYCVCCRTGIDDVREAEIADAKNELADDPDAALVVEALLRNAGMAYLDSTSPEEAARVTVRALREAGRLS